MAVFVFLSSFFLSLSAALPRSPWGPSGAYVCAVGRAVLCFNGGTNYGPGPSDLPHRLTRGHEEVHILLAVHSAVQVDQCCILRLLGGSALHLTLHLIVRKPNVGPELQGYGTERGGVGVTPMFVTLYLTANKT